MKRSAEYGRPVATPTVPGEPGIWAFVFGDMAIFALYFAIIMHSRSRDPGVFDSARQHLTLTIGVLNTAVLVTSSLFVALALIGLRAGDRRSARGGFASATGCGAVFIGLKATEWTLLFSAGLGVGSDEFFMYYFTFTGIHLAHVVIGCVVLARLAAVSGDTRRPPDVRSAEVGAIYWHMVDLLWLVLFTLFYLIS